LALGAVTWALAWVALVILGPGKIAPIWPANGVVIAVLLRADRKRQLVFLAAALCGLALGGLTAGGAMWPSLELTGVDLTEIVVSSVAIRWRLANEVDLSRRRDVVICGLAAMASSGLGAAGACVVLGWIGHGALIQNLCLWTLADSLGQMIGAPIVLAMIAFPRRPPISRRDVGWIASAIIGLAVVVIGAFAEAGLGLKFLIFAPMLVVVFQMEALGAALGALLTTVLAIAFMLAGHDPMGLDGFGPAGHEILLQIFLLASVVINFPVAAALAERRRAQEAVKVSEANYRLLADSAPDVIARVHVGGVIDYVSSAAQHLTGHGVEALAGTNFFDLVHHDDKALVQSKLAKFLRQTKGATLRGVEFRLIRKDGAEVCIEANAYRLIDADTGDTLGVGAFLRDVTRRRAMEQALRRRRAEARASEQARRAAEEAARETQAELARVGRLLSVGEFATSVAHELNQPIAAIITNGDTSLRWLDKDPPDLAEARAAIGRAMRDAHRAGDVIARTRAMLSKTPPSFSNLDLNACVAEVLLFTDLELRRHRIAVIRRFADPSPLVWGDKVQLQQVIINLVRNGIEAMTANTDRPRRLTLTTTKSAGGDIMLTIEDTGGGIAPETQAHLFDSFFTTKVGGVGLGLPISRTIIEAHGGRLWATSDGRAGAVFNVTLPPAASQ
jgi:PAS domain S-box-containing protein